MSTKKSSKKSSFRGKVAKNVKQQSERNNSAFGYLNVPRDLKSFSPEPGSKVKFDIIPYRVNDEKHPDRDTENGIAVPGELWYTRPFKVHRNIGADNDTVICPASFGQRCPICEHAKAQSRAGADKEELKDLWPKSRNLYIIIPKGHDKFEEVPHIFDISAYCFQNKLNEEVEADEEFEVFPDLEEGLTLEVRFAKGSMGGNSKPFAQASRVDFIKRKEAYDESIVDEIPCLDGVFKILSYTELKAKFFEAESVEDVEEDTDDTPVRSKKTTASAKPPKEVDEDEDAPAPPAKVSKVVNKVEKPVEKKKKKLAPPTAEELVEMDQDDLEAVIEQQELDINIDDFDGDVNLLCEAVADELDIELPGVDEDVPEEEVEDEPTDTWETIAPMTDSKLRKYVKDNKLKKVDPDDYEDDVNAFRNAVAKAAGIEIPKKKVETKPESKKKVETKPKGEICVACQGTGKNSRGKECPICEGTGQKKVKAPEADEKVEPEEKVAKKAKISDVKPAPADGKNKCPHGHIFGKDTDDFDDCGKCKIWEACIDKKEG